jgi:tetratricopeptide (TPR) repeat protein
MKSLTLITVLCGVALGTAAGIWLVLGPQRQPFGIDHVRRLLAARKFAEAIDLSRALLQREPEQQAARLYLGEALQRADRTDEAIDVLRSIPLESKTEALAGRLSAATILIQLGRLDQAETALEEARQTGIENPLTDELEIDLRNLSGQRDRSLPLLHRAIMRPQPELAHLIYLGNPDEMPAPPDDVFAAMYAAGEPLGLLGAAYTAAALHRDTQAEELLDRVAARRPELIDVAVLRLMLRLDAGRYDEFLNLVRQLPQAVEDHPGYWFQCGRAAHLLEDLPGAIRCYWETLRRQPNHGQATYQLGQALASLGERETAAGFLDRGLRLAELTKLCAEIFDGRKDVAEYWKAAELARRLGRLPECRGWCELIVQAQPNHRQARQMLQRLYVEWRKPAPPLLPEQDLAAIYQGERHPLPDWSRLASQRPAPGAVAARQANMGDGPRIRFRDAAAETGLSFLYENGDDPDTPGKRMFEYTGGGVGILDFDRDGWSDVYLTQGSAEPGRREQRAHLDVLYRNRLGVHWVEVAGLARIIDGGFGQGVSCGDYDNDGFVDLYVANIDGNRLWRNQGDGTFDDVTSAAGVGHEFWTTTCMMADINADGVADLYDVTFLTGPDIFDRICAGEDGVLRSCAPAGFPAAPDVVSLGQGDGTFRRLTSDAGFDVPDGDGLGIVAADFDQSGKLSLFVGNDGRANFYFVPSGSAPPYTQWQELGVLSGLAYDDAGRAQACMGIAAADATNDGLVDLFVTNFYLESNAYYVNLGQQAFADRARTAGLREPSLEKLGFGAQFLDADRDGWEDLVCVNGHVDDFTHKAFPYKMPPQLFHNRDGRFTELAADIVGDVFRREWLGRGLATVDWNRDQLVDVVTSNIGDPAALITNETAQAGVGLTFQLVGRTGSRDAVGTRVRVTRGRETKERQRTAGDGYHASNEPRVRMGLGTANSDVVATEMVEVEIVWPGGAPQRFALPAETREYLVIEGRAPLKLGW